MKDKVHGGHVAILGMMAAGKTTVGELLAKRLGRRFLDSDHQIQAKTGREVHQIEAAEGLNAVHSLEFEMLGEGLAAPRPVVIAAAASVIEHAQAEAVLDSAAFVVWLRIRPETMLRRMAKDPDNRHRPTLGAGTDAEALEKLAGINDGRARAYEARADLVLDVDEMAPDEAVRAILTAYPLPELLLDTHDVVGESPLWDARESVLWWVDITGKRIHRLDPESDAHDVWETPREPTSIAPRRSGGIVVTTPRGIEVFDPEKPLGERLSLLIPIEEDMPETRANDAKCDRLGRYWVGTMAYDLTAGAGRVYRVEPSGEMTTVIPDATLSNGMAWTEDDETFYWADSLTHAVYGFDFDLAKGVLSNRRVVAPVGGQTLNPDGVTIDTEGCLWVAYFSDGPGSVSKKPGGINRIAPDGKVLMSIELPVTYTTSMCFGGGDLRDLFITTGSNDVPKADLVHEPHTGGLFRWRADVTGSVLHPFGG